MPYKREVLVRERFLQKFDLLQLAREEGNGKVFDEVARSIEVLLMLVPNAHDEFLLFKKELDEELNKGLNKIGYEASYAKDRIDEAKIRNDNSEALKWEYREVLEEETMHILFKYNLVSMDDEVLNNERENKADILPS